MRTTITRLLAPGLLAPVGVVAALLVLAAGSALGQPAVVGPPASETARFRLVIEGTVTATTDLDLGTASGACDAQINANMKEKMTYRRGRGVVMEFVRLGKGPRAPVFLKRAGRARDATFSVDVESTRTSSGSASRTGPDDLCLPITEDLSQGPECGVPQQLKAKAGLSSDRFLALRLKFIGLGSVLDIECPVSKVAGGTLDVRFGWPTPPPLRATPSPLPAAIFGRKRVFVLRTSSVFAREVQPLTYGPVSGSATHFGRNEVTIRLIRQS